MLTLCEGDSKMSGPTYQILVVNFEMCQVLRNPKNIITKKVAKFGLAKLLITSTI